MEPVEFEEHRHLPDVNRLSVLVAVVMLGYALTPYIKTPEQVFALRLPGAIFPIVINSATLISFPVALLAATGTIWLLQTHPHSPRQGSALGHGILPALTAWVIGVPLTNLQVGLSWWGVFALGGLLFVLVLISEYIVIDSNDVRHSLAAVGLSAITFALFLILTIAMRAAATRLYLLIPTLFAAVGLVTLRTLYLRLNGRWCWAWALGIAAAVCQFAIGLHYLPLSALQFGLFLLAPAYALISLAGSLEEGRQGIPLWMEPALMATILWIVAISV